MNPIRPGKGWNPLSANVWEHKNGARIHIMGVIRLPDRKTFYSLNKYPGMIDGNMFVRVNGGNRKRGLMAWAVALTQPAG